MNKKLLVILFFLLPSISWANSNTCTIIVTNKEASAINISVDTEGNASPKASSLDPTDSLNISVYSDSGESEEGDILINSHNDSGSCTVDYICSNSILTLSKESCLNMNANILNNSITVTR